MFSCSALEEPKAIKIFFPFFLYSASLMRLNSINKIQAIHFFFTAATQ